MKQFSRAIITWPWVHWKNKTYKLRSRTFDFLGGYGWLQKKNILQTDFEEKKFLQWSTWPEKNSYTEKLYLSWSIMLEKIVLLYMLAKDLAKNQVCAIFHMRDIRKNVLPKFIKLCMEAPCLCPFEGHKYGRRKLTETSVFEFSY